MEAALIYAASNSLQFKVQWMKISSDTEWIYFGSGKDVNQSVVLKKIQEFFTVPTVLVAVDRKTSFIAPIDDLPKLLDGILGVKNFLIWDAQFKRVLEFSAIGVMRQGYLV